METLSQAFANLYHQLSSAEPDAVQITTLVRAVEEASLENPQALTFFNQLQTGGTATGSAALELFLGELERDNPLPLSLPKAVASLAILESLLTNHDYQSQENFTQVLATTALLWREYVLDHGLTLEVAKSQAIPVLDQLDLVAVVLDQLRD